MCCKNPVGITVVSLLLRPLSPFCSSPEQPVSSAHCVLSRLSLYIYSCYIYICVYIYIYLLITQSCFINAGSSSIWVILPVPAWNSFWHIVSVQEIFLDWNHIDRHKHLYRPNCSLLHSQIYLPSLIGSLFKKNFLTFFWSHRIACGFLISYPGMELTYPTLEVLSLNH